MLFVPHRHAAMAPLVGDGVEVVEAKRAVQRWHCCFLPFSTKSYMDFLPPFLLPSTLPSLSHPFPSLYLPTLLLSVLSTLPPSPHSAIISFLHVWLESYSFDFYSPPSHPTLDQLESSFCQHTTDSGCELTGMLKAIRREFEKKTDSLFSDHTHNNSCEPRNIVVARLADSSLCNSIIGLNIHLTIHFT